MAEWANRKRTGDKGSYAMSTRPSLLDPTAEDYPAHRKRCPRPSSLSGLTVGLLDISKPRGDIFLNRLEVALANVGIHVERYTKPPFTKPAPIDLRHEIASKCDAVIEALAD